MLDMGFIDDVKKIVGLCPKERQTMLFSATWPRAVHKLAKSLTLVDNTATIMVGAKAGKPKGEDGECGGDVQVVPKGQPTANEAIVQTVEVLSSGAEKQAILQNILWKNK